MRFSDLSSDVCSSDLCLCFFSFFAFCTFFSCLRRFFSSLWRFLASFRARFSVDVSRRRSRLRLLLRCRSRPLLRLLSLLSCCFLLRLRLSRLLRLRRPSTAASLYLPGECDLSRR